MMHGQKNIFLSVYTLILKVDFLLQAFWSEILMYLS